MWPHHVILNGYVCIFSNKIMPRPNGKTCRFLLRFLAVLFIVVVFFFFFRLSVKYICGYTLKACQTFEIGFAIRKTWKVSIGFFSSSLGRAREMWCWEETCTHLKPMPNGWKTKTHHYPATTELATLFSLQSLVCVQRHYQHISARCRCCHQSTSSLFYSFFL